MARLHRIEGALIVLTTMAVSGHAIALNLLPNGDFERSAARLESWRFFNVGRGSASASIGHDAYSGSNAALLTVSSSDGIVDAGLDTWDDRIAVAGNQVLRVSFASKMVSGERTRLACDLHQFRSDGTQLACASFNVEPSGTVYKVFARMSRIHPDAVFVSVGFRIKDADNALSVGSYLLDDVRIEAVSAPTTASLVRRAGWVASEEWTISSPDSLSVSAIGETFAWNTAAKPLRTWQLSADISIPDMGSGVGTSRLVFGDSRRKPMLTVGVERHVTGISQVTVDVPGRQLMLSRAIPGGSSSYAVSVSRDGDRIGVSVHGGKGFVYAEETPKVDPRILDSITMFGLGSLAGGVEFSNVALRSPAPKPGHYESLARSAMEDLVRNYWIGGLDDGYIVPTYNGYPGATSSPMPKGAVWERNMMLFAMDSYYEATGDRLAKRRMASQWEYMKRTFTKEELEAAGSIIHPACDDSGWDGMSYMIYYHRLGDPYALEAAKGLISNAFARWLDDDFGGGMKYDNRKMKSLYQVGVANCALQIWEATGDKTFYDRALNCYNWAEAHLLRPDGLYWCDYDSQGPALKDRPNDIFEGGSVTFLGGNMGMAILHARLYRITGDRKYLDRAVRTADAISRKETKRGVYLNDRDAWSNGTFAGMWAREVLTLPGFDPKHRKLLLRTADSIYKRSRTPDGHYGGCWSGPADGPDSPWQTGGFRAQQIMTSASTANMIMGAAVAEKDGAGDGIGTDCHAVSQRERRVEGRGWSSRSMHRYRGRGWCSTSPLPLPGAGRGLSAGSGRAWRHPVPGNAISAPSHRRQAPPRAGEGQGRGRTPTPASVPMHATARPAPAFHPSPPLP